MKVFEQESSAAHVLLAALPILVLMMDVPGALYFGAVFFAVFWLTVFFFSFALSLFPRILHRPVYFLWFAFWAQLVFVFFEIIPVWIFSLFLLLPPAFFFEAPSRSGVLIQAFSRGAFFFVLLIFMAAFHDILSGQLLVWSFFMPAGAFFLLALAAVLWQNQPGVSSQQQRADRGAGHE